VLRGRDAVLGQGGMDPVLEGGPQLAERHPGVVELSFIADLAGRQPDRGQPLQMKEFGEALG